MKKSFFRSIVVAKLLSLKNSKSDAAKFAAAGYIVKRTVKDILNSTKINALIDKAVRLKILKKDQIADIKLGLLDLTEKFISVSESIAVDDKDVDATIKSLASDVVEFLWPLAKGKSGVKLMTLSALEGLSAKEALNLPAKLKELKLFIGEIKAYGDELDVELKDKFDKVNFNDKCKTDKALSLVS